MTKIRALSSIAPELPRVRIAQFFHSQRGPGQNSARAIFVNSRIGTNTYRFVSSAFAVETRQLNETIKSRRAPLELKGTRVAVRRSNRKIANLRNWSDAENFRKNIICLVRSHCPLPMPEGRAFLSGRDLPFSGRHFSNTTREEARV